jgi:hypothetical protein
MARDSGPEKAASSAVARKQRCHHEEGKAGRVWLLPIKHGLKVSCAAGPPGETTGIAPTNGSSDDDLPLAALDRKVLRQKTRWLQAHCWFF